MPRLPIAALAAALTLVATQAASRPPSPAAVRGATPTTDRSASGAPTWAAAVSAALARTDPGARTEALRRQGTAVRDQADGWIAADPALRVKTTNDRPAATTGYYEWEAMLDLPLWLPGQRAARRALAESLGLGADALERYLRWEVAGKVRELAWDTALAEGRLEHARHALEDARTLESQVARRVQAGELADLDLLLARQETLAQEAALVAARAEYDTARERYASLTQTQTLPSPLAEPVAQSSGLSPDHPGLAAAEAAVAQSRAERDRAVAERRGTPILSLGGKRTHDSGDSAPYDSLMLEVSIPFGLASQSAPRIAEAERGLTESAAERQRLYRELETEIQVAVAARDAAVAALAAAERRQALAGKALDLVRRGFELGELDLAALLRERTKAQEAALDLSLRRLELGRAGSRLDQALGAVPQ